MYVRVGDPEARRVKRVLLNGEDVTQRCFAADDDQAFVRLYKTNEHGKWIRSDDGPEEELLFGDVQIEMKA